jgi:hypothetical protein
MPREPHVVARINNAVKACVDRASDSNSPLSVLMETTNAYRDSEEWTDDEMAEFELAVLQILRKLRNV